MQSSDESVTSHENRKKYSLAFKVKNIAAANKEGNRPVASRLEISEFRIIKSHIQGFEASEYQLCWQKNDLN
uniref:Transposase n=1 Tax=Romanomermis culicivorax TaxID=13658 RepID=A0A915JP47_ROMCU